MKQCMQCNKAFDDESQFCPLCGGTLTEGAEIASVQPQHKEFTYLYEKTSGIRVLSEIIADDDRLKISQTNRLFFFKTSRKQYELRIQDISEIKIKKTINFVSLFYTISGILFCLLAGSWLWGLGALIFGCFFLKDKYIYIYHNGGNIKIRDLTTYSQQTEEFVDYVRQYNPQAVQNVVFES